jgi:hypothetical protein
LYSLECVAELVFCEDGVGVFDLVHVRKPWCVVVKSWVCLLLYVVVYLDSGAASVFPCLEGVGGCKGANGFDDGCELRFGGICPPRAGACVGSGVVGK